MSTLNHQDIRIGTLAPMNKGAGYISQILPHGFESFQLTCWEFIGDVNVEHTAKEVLEVIDGKAVINSIGIFGNPLQKEQTAKDWEVMIRSAKHFGAKTVCGFAGVLEDRPVDQSLAKFKEVWTPLVKLAEDEGVKIGFENCSMGGTWEAPKWNMAHSPRAWEMMFNEIQSDSIGLEWEPCHQLESLIDPLAQLKHWVGKVVHVHGKDGTVFWDVIKEHGIRGGKPYMYHRTPGFGDTNWTDVISILRLNGYTGSIDIEGWHDPVYVGDLEMTGQVYSMNYLKQCRGGVFIANPE